ncbi:MAG: CBS domain-containing protein [Myxococcota bacterium]
MYEFLEYRVEHVMTREVVTIGPETSVEQAQAIFEEHDFDSLPVLDESRQLIGVLSKLDLCKAFAFTRTSMLPRYDEIVSRPVKDYMNRQPARVEPDVPLTRVLATLIETGFKSLPVLQDGRLLGIVAREDVLAAIHRAADGLLPEGSAA